ncbi:MAG: trypsin-like peptidase domain-containing protein [candidate division Zixibacteria bacterium]|nr:trypsin-like peptidase domain-containing protein [candidate division Zixibacteria bacterium]
MKLSQVVGFLVITFFIAGSASAQLSEGGMPISFGKSIATSLGTDIPVEQMGSIDVSAYLAEDAIEEAEGGIPYRFGAPFDVDYSLDNSGIWENLPDGGRLWRLRIESPEAYSINLIYEDYWLPEGAKLYIYNEQHDFIIGAFTSTNNKEHGMFATQPVKGDVSIIEYYEPADVRGLGKIKISRVVHAYKDIFSFFADKAFGSSGSCNNNVNCPEGDDWLDEKRGVAMILLGSGTRWCTGSMVNNVRQDARQLFLTANHCLNGPENWIIMFNYESPGCANIDGPTNMTIQGTTVRASYSASDFALVELSEAIPEAWGIYYNGWTAINTEAPNTVCIHHPAGDIKKISFDDDPVTSTDYLSNTVNSSLSHWRITAWDDGTTEGGSSGSPLFDPQSRIVGQLHGGYASCTSITSDWYGKFSYSWAGGGTSSTQLKFWLDPDYTGATTLDGWDPYGGTTISHTPLEDTRDTVNDYSVVATIKSAVAALDPSTLRLHYTISSLWLTIQLDPTGTPDEFDADIPAQPAGTVVQYYITAADIENNADTTDVFDFLIEYSPSISVNPGAFNESVNQGDSTTAQLTIDNVGTGNLEYSIGVIPSLNKFAAFNELLKNEEVEPARRFYSQDILDFNDAKESDEHPDGFPVDKNAGGPDGLGYFWMDSDESGGPVFSWIDISSSGTDITAGIDDDNFIGPYPIGFNFPYHGYTYTEFYFGSNGIIGFDTAQMKSRSKQPIPTASVPNNILAWLWDDLDITDADNTSGRVYYESYDNRLIIQIVDYPEYRADPGDVINAEVILESDGSITYQYLSFGGDFDTQNCAVGIEDSTGTDGLETAYLTAYLKDNFAIKYFMPYQWLMLDKYNGTVAQGTSDTVVCTFLSEELAPGDHSASIIVTSNDLDPGQSPITVIANLEVTSGPQYLCGDANGDETVNVADAVYIINFAFKGGPAPDPMEKGDPNCDAVSNIGDAVYIINYVFKGGPAPCANCP